MKEHPIMEIYDEAEIIESQVYNIMKKIIYWESGMNIVDLGLVYDIKFLEEKGIIVTITLSDEFCLIREIIMNDISNILYDEFPELKHKVESNWTYGYLLFNGRIN